MEEEDIILFAQLTRQAPAPLPVPLVTPQYARTNRYMSIEVDLSVAHTNKALGLSSGITYLWVTIERADSPFTYKLNKVTNNSLIGSVGASVTQHEFTEIYVTNAAASATSRAVFTVGWRD